MADSIKGVDVASYQSTTYDLNGLDFVFVKATEGTSYVNPKMGTQANRSRDAGLVTGFYHFLRKGNPEAQAAYFVSKAGARSGETLACDWETAPDGTYPSNEEKDRFIRECKRLAPQHRTVLYCNLDFWLNRDRTGYAGDGLWIADPGAQEGNPRIQHAWLYHQYSITGGIDRNVANFPTRQALREWANGLRPAEAETPMSNPLDLSQHVPLGAWAKAAWPDDKGIADGAVSVQTALGSGYAHARLANERTARLEGEVSAMRAQLDAQSAALTALGAQLDALGATLAQLDVSVVLGALQAAINGTQVTLHAGEVTS